MHTQYAGMHTLVSTFRREYVAIHFLEINIAHFAKYFTEVFTGSIDK